MTLFRDLLLRAPATLGLLLLLLTAAACSSVDDAKSSSKPGDQKCLPGTSYTCTNITGCSGRASCLADGSGMTPCMCNAGQAGQQANDEDSGLVDASTGQDASTTDAAVSGGSCNDATHACVPAAVKGFKGPIALYVGKAAPPACGAAFSIEAFSAGDDPEGDEATCAACSCTSSCTEFLNFSTSGMTGCAGSACTTSVNGSCVDISPTCLKGHDTAYLKTKLPDGASCESSKGHTTKDKAAFGTHVLGCELKSARREDCDSGQVCAPKETEPKFGDALCVWAEGEVSCPSKRYTDKHVYQQTLVDTRSCSACGCTASGCSYEWQVFASDDASCTTPIVSLSSEDQCVEVNPTGNKLRVGVAISGSAQCTADGGDPQGGVQGADPITVCCEE